jgi:hypothetical protein
MADGSCVYFVKENTYFKTQLFSKEYLNLVVAFVQNLNMEIDNKFLVSAKE